MQVSWSGVVVFVAFCLMLVVARERPAFTPIAEIVATVLIALGITGVMVPRARRPRGLDNYQQP